MSRRLLHPERVLVAALRRSDAGASPAPQVRRGAHLEAEVRHLAGGHAAHRRILDLLLDLPPGPWQGRAAGGVAVLLHHGLPVASHVRTNARGEADALPSGSAEALRALARRLPPGARIQAPDLTAHERLLLAPWAEPLAPLVEIAPGREVRLHRHGRALALVLHGLGDPDILLLLPA